MKVISLYNDLWRGQIETIPVEISLDKIRNYFNALSAFHLTSYIRLCATSVCYCK